MAIKLRTAVPDDSGDIFAWRNDVLTRRMSRAGDEIAWAEHSQWFVASLENPRRWLFVVEADDGLGRKIGVVRFDLDEAGATAEISINLNPAARGQGAAAPSLRAGVEAFRALAPDCGEIVAEIKPENVASVRAFEAAGFRHIGANGPCDVYALRCG